MKLDLFPLETWETLNSTIKNQWSVASDVSVRVYSDLPAAVYEVAQGTAQFLSHKRSLAFIKGQTFAIQPLLPYFYKEAYQIQILSHQGLADMKTWVENLKKDTLFVLFCEDHPVTGEKYPWQEMDALLNEKRIFSVRISHNSHFVEEQEILPYSIRICSYSQKMAVAFCGNKFKSPPLIAPAGYWGSDELKKEVLSLERKKQDDKKLVTQFETNLPEGFHRFINHEQRVYDRAVIYSKDVNGEAVQQYISTALNLPMNAPGAEALIETTSLCRWGGTKGFDDWWEPVPDKNTLRGLLVIDVKLLKNPELTAELKKALDQCRI